MKTISIFLALINALVAGLLLTFTISARDLLKVESMWLIVKILAAMSIIVIGVLTWLSNMRPVKPGVLPLTSLFLVVLGTGTVVWTFQRGLFTGDMEYYIAFFGVSLFAQGLASLFGLAGDPRSIVAS